MIVAKILEVSAKNLRTEYDLEGKEIETGYTFEAHEFSNGLIIIPDLNSYSWFFPSRGEIEANGSNRVTSIKDTLEIDSYSQEEFLSAVAEAKEWYGEDSVPDSYKDLLGDRTRLIE